MADTQESDTQDQLPTWDQAMTGSAPPPSDANAAGSNDNSSNPPTWDEALKQDQPSNEHAISTFFQGAFGGENFTKEGQAQRVALLQQSRVGRFVNAIGAVPVDFLKDSGKNIQQTFSEENLGFDQAALNKLYQQSQHDWDGGIFNGVVLPTAAATVDAFNKIGGSLFSGYQSASEKFGENIGEPQLGRDISAMPEAFFGEGHSGVHPEVVKARSNNVIGNGVDEAVYMGTKPVPEMAAAEQHEAARQAAAYEPVSEESLPEERPKDIHEVARNIAPDTFNEYDRLTTSKEALSSSLNFLREQRQTEAEASAPHADEINDLKEKLEDANPRKAKIYQDKIDQLTEANDDAIQQAKAKDTPEMAQIRQRLQDIDYRMRDLAPDVSAAYRSAKEFAPEEGTQTKQTGNLNNVNGFKTEKGSVYQINDDGTTTRNKSYHPEHGQNDQGLQPSSNETFYVTEQDAEKLGEFQVNGDNKSIQKSSDGRYGVKYLSGKDTGKFESRTMTNAKRIPEEGLIPVELWDDGKKVHFGNKITEVFDKKLKIHEPVDNIENSQENTTEKNVIKSSDEQHANIVNDITQKLTGLGRSTEEAKASAEIVGRFFRTMSEIYGGAKGTAEDWYAKEGTNIRAGQERAKVLAQKKYKGTELEQRQEADTKTPQFKKWFGESKVVDENGEPQIVYHGTNKSFQKFDVKKGAQPIIWFTSDKSKIDTEEVGASGKGRILEMYASLKNPASWEEYEKYGLDELFSMGYDGAILKDSNGSFSGFAFEPTQLKSIYNKGSFDGKDPRLLEQNARGKIRLATDEAKATISLFSGANASTFMHESAHNFLDIMTRYAAEEDAPKRLKDDVNVIHQYLGTEEGEYIKTSQHEKFARSFERYLMEGIAPSKDLANIFEKFRKWLTDIYKTVERLRAPITDEIRDVFDRLLSNKVEEPIIAPEKPIAKISDGTGLFEGTKVEGIANKLSKMFAGIHKIDAENTKPEHADASADRIGSEIDQIAKTHDKEAYDALTNPETSKIPAEAPSNEPAGPSPEPIARTEGPASESPAVLTGGSQAETTGGGIRGEGASGAAAGEASRNATGAGESAASAEATSGKSGSDGQGKQTDPNQRFGPGKSDLVDKAGNIRLDLLNTTADIDKVLKDTANENDNFTQERRGVISNGMTLDLADALGMDPTSLDTRKIGEAFSAEKIVAAVKLLVQSAKDVNEAAKSGDIEKYTEIRERHRMIQGHVSGITAEAGRALQIFQSFKKIEGYDQVKALAEFLKQNDNGKTLNQLEEEMNFAAKLDRPQQVSKFVQDSGKKNFKDMILEYYINSLISGPITHARYAIGNAINALWTPLIEIPLAAVIGKTREIISGEVNPDRVHLGESKAQLYAIGKGARDGYQAAIEAFQKGQSPALPTERVSAQFLDVHQNAIPGKLGQVINFPGRSVSAIHSFFKSLRYEQNIAGLAYRQAMDEGLEGGEFDGRVAELSKSPTEDMMQSATKDALKELYMAPTDYHSAMASLTRFTNQSVLAKIVVPFMKIGSQITRNAFIERTPLGLFDKETRANLAGANGLPTRDMQIAKMTAGISLMGVTALAAAEGMATGDGPTDPKERAIWMLNHRPNSLTIGNLTVPYQGLGSLGMLMRFSANMYQTAHAWDGDKGSEVAMAAMEGITKSVLDENFMRGVKDMLDALYHPEEYGARYLQGFVTNWLPFSVGQSQIARKIDPYQREVISQGWSNAFGIIDEAKAKTPFVSQSLEPRRDRFGQPIQNGGNDIYANDPVVKRMEALNTGISKLERKIRGIPLSDQQYDDFSRLAGTMTKMRLNALITPGFSNIPAQAQIAAIDKVVGQSREMARKLTMMKYPEIIKEANDAKAIKKYGKPVSGTVQ